MDFDLIKTKIIKIEDIKKVFTVSFNNIKNWHLKYLNSIQAINALAAISILNELKLDISVGMKIISEMKPLSGRGEIITINFECKNKSFLIDDSYNANPQSMKAAIDSLKQFSGKKVLVLGAMAELGKDSKKLHQQIGDYAREQNIDNLLTIGQEALD